MATTKKVAAPAKSSLPVKILKTKTEAISTEVIVSSVESQAKGHFSKLKKFDKIKSKEDMALASQQVKALKEIAKEAKRQKEDITGPIYQAIEKIELLFKPFEDKVKAADKDIKEKIDAFLLESENKLKQIESDFKNNKIKKVSTFTEKTNELQIGSTGDAKVRNVTKLSITDLKKIPAKFFVLDERAVEAALKNGEIVPGAKLIKIKQVAI